MKNRNDLPNYLRRLKRILTIGFCYFLCNTFSLYGQDAYFSNMESAPTLLNPALTGAMQGNIRIITKYRSQWDRVLGNLAYKNKFAALDFRVCLDYNGQQEAYIAGGVNFQREEAGQGGFYTQNIGLTFAYHHQLDRDIFLAAGANLSFFDYGLDIDALTFDEQFDTQIGYNPNRSSLEDFSNLAKNAFNLDLGLTLYSAEANWTLGAALFHINQPNFSLQIREDENQLEMGFAIHGSKAIPLGDKQGLFRGIYRKQTLFNSSRQWQLITGFVYDFKAIKKFSRSANQGWHFMLGLSSRLAGNNEDTSLTVDAIIPSIILEDPNWKIQLSYDVNVSPLARRNNFFNGGFEATLIYQFKLKNACVFCPDF